MPKPWHRGIGLNPVGQPRADQVVQIQVTELGTLARFRLVVLGQQPPSMPAPELAEGGPDRQTLPTSAAGLHHPVQFLDDRFGSDLFVVRHRAAFRSESLHTSAHSFGFGLRVSSN